MLRILKIVGIIVGTLLTILVIAGLIMHETRPVGVVNSEADELARKMINAVDGVAWDTTEAVSWNFSDMNSHLWDKNRHFAQVKWGDHVVLVNINERTGVARTNGQVVLGDAGDKLVQKAWYKWANDSFWLNPVTKAFDNGTERSIVELENGEKALMVTYTSGGATPGDSYLWILDENGLPVSWKMWVKIIPVGGFESSWENWIRISTGAQIATLHAGLLTLNIKEVKGGKLSELVQGGDPFQELEQ